MSWDFNNSLKIKPCCGKFKHILQINICVSAQYIGKLLRMGYPPPTRQKIPTLTLLQQTVLISIICLIETRTENIRLSNHKEIINVRVDRLKLSVFQHVHLTKDSFIYPMFQRFKERARKKTQETEEPKKYLYPVRYILIAPNFPTQHTFTKDEWSILRFKIEVR